MKARIKAALAARFGQVQAGVVGLVALGVSSAHAALPAEATAAFTSMNTDGSSMIAQGWPILVAITGGLILMGIFKKVLSRAT